MDTTLDVACQEPDTATDLLAEHAGSIERLFQLIEQLKHTPERRATHDDPCEDIAQVVLQIQTLAGGMPGPSGTDFLRYASIVLRYHPWRAHNSCLLELEISLLRQVLALQPPEHSGHWDTLSKLSESLSLLFQLKGSLPTLEGAVALGQQALQLSPQGYADRGHILKALAHALYLLCMRTGKLGALEECIELLRQSLDLCPPGHTRRAQTLRSLSGSLLLLCQMTDNLDALEEGIEFDRQSLELCPPGHAGRARTLNSLGDSLSLLCQMTGKLDALEESIELGRQSLNLCPLGHADRAHALKSLGSSLHLLCEMTGTLDALEESIELDRQSLELYPPGHTHREHTLRSLGTSLFLLCQMTGNLDALEESIQLLRESLELCPSGHAHRGHTLRNLGTSLHLRCMRIGKLGALEECIELLRQSLDLCPPGHADRAHTLKILSTSLILLCQMTGNLDALEEGIELDRQSLELCPPGHPHRADTLKSLGNSLCQLCQMAGKLDALEESIELIRESLELCPPGHVDRAHTLKCLGISLSLLCQMTGQLDALEESIELLRQSLELCPPGNAERAPVLQNLGILLCLSCQMTGNLDALEESIGLMRQSLELCPVDHENRASTLKSLGSSLFLLFQMTGKLDAIEESIELLRQSMHLCPPEHAARAGTLSSLGSSLHMLYQRTGKLGALEESIELKRQALELCPPGHTQKPHILNLLGSSLHLLYQRTGTMSTLEESIQLLRQSLELYPPGHADRVDTLQSLGLPLHSLYQVTKSLPYLEESMDLELQSIQHSRPASDDLFWASSWLADIFLAKYLHTSEVALLAKGMQHVCTALGQAMVPAHLRLSQVHTSLSKMYTVVLGSAPSLSELKSELFSTFSKAVHLLPYAAYFGLHMTAQLTTLHSSEGLGSRTCMLALLLDNPNESLELFEEAHGVFWLQALRLRSPLDDLDEQERGDLTRIFQVLEAGVQPRENQDPHWHERQTAYLRQASVRAEAMIDDIRQRPGFSRFLLPPLFSGLAHVAAHGPVVVLVSQDKLSEAIVILNAEGTIERVRLPGVSTSELHLLGKQVRNDNLRRHEAVSDRNQADAQGISESPQDSGRDANETRFGKTKTQDITAGTQLLHRIWTAIVQPVIKTLRLKKKIGSRDRPRVHWCATGPFAFLPLHAAYAAETTGAQCSDFLVSSYTPTLTALLNARQSLQPMSFASMTALLIAVKSAPKMPTLENAAEEVELAERILSPMKRIVYGTKRDRGAGARVQEVIDALPAASFLHLACHGEQDMKNPLQSAFCLQDKKLTVEALMKLKLKDAFFAFLGACETAKGDEKHRDQAVHLAAAMLFVGFRSIIGTMWSMNDYDGLFITRIVYKELMKNEVLDFNDIPYALDLAVQQLRKEGLGPHRWAPYIHIGA